MYPIGMETMIKGGKGSSSWSQLFLPPPFKMIFNGSIIGKTMLFLRYQKQHQEEISLGRAPPSDHDMRRKMNDRDVKGDSHRAATKGTLICIFVCGTLLLSFGLTVLLAGLLVPKLKKDPTPWLVIGPTCIVLGILVLLLSVEIILKLKKISADSSDSRECSAQPETKQSEWKSSNAIQESSTDTSGRLPMSMRIPVVVQPPTPISELNASTLPLAVNDKP